MKKIRLIAGNIPVIAMFALLCACTPEPQQIQTESHTLTDTVLLVQGQPYCMTIDFDIDFPMSYPDEDALKSIQQHLLSSLFEENYSEMSINDAMVQYKNELATEYRLNNEPILPELEENASETMYSLLHNEHILKGYAMYESNKIFSYTVERYVFMGGAHGITTRMFRNFDKQTGNLLNEEDLFTENYMDNLTPLLIQNLIRQNEGMESADDLEAASYYVESIKPNNNFYVSDEGITYVFNPYEIAPYYMGEIDILIPASELKPFLNANQQIF